MEPLRQEWAGAERRFFLPLGCVLDLEEACGKVGIGEIFLRVSRQTYFANDLYQIIKQGLIGGGMEPDEAKRLVDQRFDVRPYTDHIALAMEILLARVAGMQSTESSGTGDPAQPMDKGKILHSLVSLGLSTEEIRAMRYDDFVAICEAAGTKAEDAPSEEEYAAMLAAWEARQGTVQDSGEPT
ncbi:gene transfer agent family protein [Aestuariibius sp. 2305UL40-4]|uniref:gene transfer agent family protein n=1 Tax=Aestuariibius violaceus TaxID=3234132 RepID=UPI00345EEDD4